MYPQQLPARVFPGGAEPFQPTPPECSLSAAPTPAVSYPHHPGPQKPTDLTAPAHPNIPPPYLSPPRASTTHREPGPGQGAWDGTASDAWEGYKEAEPSSKIQIERMFEVNTMVYWFLACSSLACDFQSAPPQPWVCSYIALLFTADLSVFPLWIHPLWIHPPDCEKKPDFGEKESRCSHRNQHFPMENHSISRKPSCSAYCLVMAMRQCSWERNYRS